MCFIYESVFYSTSVQLLFSPFIRGWIIGLSAGFLTTELTNDAFSIKLYVHVDVPGQSQYTLSCHCRAPIIHDTHDDVFVAKGFEHIWASSDHRLKWAFYGWLIDVEARAYVRTASYAPVR